VSREPNSHPLRLRKKHGEGQGIDATVADGARLIRAQSPRNAVVASLIALIVFNIFWIAVTGLMGRVFPWMTVVLGWLLGLAIRIAGRGVDWRFPVLAAGMTLAGAVLSNVVLAASTTAAEFGTGTLAILRAVTSMTWPVFFDEVWSIADSFFAALAAGLAAFLALRRLTRRQRYALRLWKEASDRHQ
jgi:hypothetical protein